MPSNRRHFLRLAFGSGLTLSLPRAWSREAPTSLLRNLPADEQVSAAGIIDFLKAIEDRKIELHSFMMLRHGKVVAEAWWHPYSPDMVHTMYSMSKSFTAVAVGFAVAEGKLKTGDKVIGWFPEDLPETVSDNLAAMRVSDLLAMSSGHGKDPTQAVVKSDNWARTFLSLDIAHRPGSVFMYNSAATYMCSAIVRKAVGKTVLDYLREKLFTPLGIDKATWETCPMGISTGGWGLSIQTESMAKFGQWLLQKGHWQGTQLLPAEWIEEATRFHIQQPGDDKPDRLKADNDWLQGYGYQFWRCRHGAFRGDGAFGQFTIVLPGQDAVIVMTSENGNMQGQLDLVWQHLLPAIGQSAANATDIGSLTQRLRKTSLPPLQSQQQSAIQRQPTPLTYTLEPNNLGLTSVEFRFQGKQGDIIFHDEKNNTHRVTVTDGAWALGSTRLPGTPPRLISGGGQSVAHPYQIAGSAAWIDDSTWQMLWRYIETPHSDQITCRFEEDTRKITISFLNSISRITKAKDQRPNLVGRIA